MIATDGNGRPVSFVGFNIIPSWIADAVMQRRLPLKTLFEAEKLMEIIPMSELYTYIAVDNEKFQDKLFGAPALLASGTGDVLPSSVLYGLNNYSTLYESFKPQEGPVFESFVRSCGVATSERTVLDDVEARLFTEESRNENDKKPFIIYDITPQRLGVVIYPGFFVGNELQDLQFELMECLLKQLYVFLPKHVVAGTPLFRRYVERLATKDVIIST